LLTGEPGSGKTTVIRRLIELIHDLRVAGFYTQELRQQGQALASHTWN
jgi:nucleoside-triphosphatase